MNRILHCVVLGKPTRLAGPYIGSTPSFVKQHELSEPVRQCTDAPVACDGLAVRHRLSAAVRKSAALR